MKNKTLILCKPNVSENVIGLKGSVYHVNKICVLSFSSRLEKCWSEQIGKSGFVVGSQSPWIEVYALLLGANEVYSSILSFLNQNGFDFAISFSSIEHSGLGRYGDAIDPIGDLREVWKILCLLKPGGTLYLGLPRGVDSVFYNAHRIYGAIRLAMLMTGNNTNFLQRKSHLNDRLSSELCSNTLFLRVVFDSPFSLIALAIV
ncbi:unnamed protein product [Angiostrongylus costaricensis]|uniref:DUF268 domain-containing protein n=1 Tax=Angiostrongylus costaricensis TaxID=334426 RepID=A0A0R3PVI4_ANGCS|nr:unnamed protein product [Angiostrongylus costaricensis]